MQPVMSADEVSAFWAEHFPQVAADTSYAILTVGPGEATLRLTPGDSHLRPGGTVSGPTLFALVDLAAYAVLLARVGPEPLILTTNVSINYLRRPPLAPLTARSRILKLGKRLAVVETAIGPEGGDDVVAQATGTYSLPT